MENKFREHLILFGVVAGYSFLAGYAVAPDNIIWHGIVSVLAFWILGICSLELAKRIGDELGYEAFNNFIREEKERE